MEGVVGGEGAVVVVSVSGIRAPMWEDVEDAVCSICSAPPSFDQPTTWFPRGGRG